MDTKVNRVYCQELFVRGAENIDAGNNFAAQLLTQPAGFTITPADGAENVCDVTIQVLDAAGNVLTGVRNIDVWVSDVATGIGMASTFDPDTITASTGTVLSAHEAAEYLVCQTDATGTLVLAVTDAAQAGGFVAVKNPVTGLITTGEITATTDYGSA